MASKRTYTDEDKANVLALLAANSGNVKRTARDTGVAEQTVRDWKKAGERGNTPSAVVALVPSAIEDFAVDAERIRDKALGALETALDAGQVTTRELVPIIGMLTEKIALARGQATQRTETVHALPSPEEFGTRLVQFLDQSFTRSLDREGEIVDADFTEQAPSELTAGAMSAVEILGEHSGTEF